MNRDFWGLDFYTIMRSDSIEGHVSARRKTRRAVFPFHAPLVICTLYFVIDFVHKTPYNGNTLVYKVNGKIKGADYKWCMKRKHPFNRLWSRTLIIFRTSQEFSFFDYSTNIPSSLLIINVGVYVLYIIGVIYCAFIWTYYLIFHCVSDKCMLS